MLGPCEHEFSAGRIGVFGLGATEAGSPPSLKLSPAFISQNKAKYVSDGKPVTNENRDAYRQLFSAVFSDFFCFR